MKRVNFNKQIKTDKKFLKIRSVTYGKKVTSLVFNKYVNLDNNQ